MTHPTHCYWSLALTVWGSLNAQDTAKAHSVTFGAEVAFRSGHEDRGYLISDRPVIQSAMWLSGNGAAFSVWGNVTLDRTTDGERPKILELDLEREYKWRRIVIGPAARMYFYQDPLSRYSERSLEGWMYLAYDAGPFRLFTRHSLDVLAYKGSYFVDAGISSEQKLSARLEIRGSLGAGWASARFNDSWFGVPQSALNRARVAGGLTAHLTPRLYIDPHFELNTTLDPEVRAALVRPSYLLVGLSMGGEF